jgi:hypothetical protein
MMETTPHACGVDDTARPSSLTNEHAFGVDDAPYPFPSPVPGLGHFNQALMGHSCQAPKLFLYCCSFLRFHGSFAGSK